MIPADEAAAAERYLLLADISGYTSFMASVERVHGVDFSAGIPAAYTVLADLLDTVSQGIEPDFLVVKLEGDAVFAAAPATALDNRGERVLDRLHATYRAFIEARTRAIPAADHTCTACPAVALLDLKGILHRGNTVRQAVGSGSDLLGPAVTIAHRLLKNTIRQRMGFGAYLFISDAAAAGLGLASVGRKHRETYADTGPIDGQVVALNSAAPGDESWFADG